MVVIIKGKPRVDDCLKSKDVLWRYLDAARFLDLVHNRRLFFVRGDQFEDKFEGAFTDSIKKAIEAFYKENEIKFSYEEFKTKLRERVFLNCWHRSPDDSMAMWSIYGRSQTSLAITTTVGKLTETIEAAKIPHNVAIKKVAYVKHWRDPEIDYNPYSNVFAHKVKAYEFEKEVRVVIDRFHEEFCSKSVEKGMTVPISLDKLLRSIVISPDAPPWFLSLVEGIVDKYEVSAHVRRSMLAFDPV